MTVDVYWEDESKTIIRYDFKGTWTWHEFYPAYQQALALETSVRHPVDVILDMRSSSHVPANALLHVKNVSREQPSNVGVSVCITSGTFAQALYNVGIQGNDKYDFRFVGTLEEAHSIIQEYRHQ